MFVLAALLLFSVAGKMADQARVNNAGRGNDTVTITRLQNGLSGTMRLNGTDVPLTNVTESDGFISFSTTFPIGLADLQTHPLEPSERALLSGDPDGAVVAQSCVAQPQQRAGLHAFLFPQARSWP